MARNQLKKQMKLVLVPLPPLDLPIVTGIDIIITIITSHISLWLFLHHYITMIMVEKKRELKM